MNNEIRYTPDDSLFILNFLHTPSLSFDTLFPYLSQSETSVSYGGDWVGRRGGIASDLSCLRAGSTTVPYWIWIKYVGSSSGATEDA